MGDDILIRLVSSAGQTSFIIFLGFLCKYLKMFHDSDLTGLNKFLANVALPAEFFFSLATLNWGAVSFPLLISLCVGKTIVYVLTGAVAYYGSSDPQRTGISGLFAIFTTKSNDIAMGVPIVTAIWGREYASYLYLFSPYQLLVINLIGFVQMEANLENVAFQRRLELCRAKSLDRMRNRARGKNESDSDKEKAESESTHATSAVVELGEGAKDIDESAETNGIMGSDTAAGGAALKAGGSSDGREEEEEEEEPVRAKPYQIAYKISKKLLSSPIIISCILGFILNLVVGHNNFPPFVLEVLETLSKTYSGAALFALGLSIKTEIKAGQSMLITTLCATKVIILPIVMALTTHILTGDETDLEFAFLYGMLPTAPTVYIFAVNYRLKETLMSSSCLVCLLASLPMILISGIAIQVHGERSEKNSNHYGLITATWTAGLSLSGAALILLLALVSRARRPFRGAWRVFSVLSVVTMFVGCFKLTCVDLNNHAHISQTQAVVLRLMEQLCNYLQRSYGVLLACVLFARCHGVPSVHRVERSGHAYVWVGCAVFILAYGLVPGLRPRYHHLPESAVGYQSSVLSCQTKGTLGMEVVELITQFSLMAISLVYIIRYQLIIKLHCEDEGLISDIAMVGEEEAGGSTRKASPGSSTPYEYQRLENPVEGKDREEEEKGRFGPKTDQVVPSGATQILAIGDAGSESSGSVQPLITPTCQDSTRYTLVVTFNAAGLILAVLMTLSRIFKMDQNARGFAQVVFILDLAFHLSAGLFFFAVFCTHRDLMWGVARIYRKIARHLPCIERLRTWLVGEIYLPEDVDDLRDPSTPMYREPSLKQIHSVNDVSSSHPPPRYIYPRRYRSDKLPGYSEYSASLPSASPYMASSVPNHSHKRNDDRKGGRGSRVRAVARPIAVYGSPSLHSAAGSSLPYNYEDWARARARAASSGEGGLRQRSVPNSRRSRLQEDELLVENPFGSNGNIM